MATYVIGDLHGCFDELLDLLKLIDFKEDRDHIFFAGDLINGAPQSLACLEYVKYLVAIPGNNCVLGNHDLALLAAGCGVASAPSDRKHGIEDILASPRLAEYMQWLKQLPLCIDLPQFNYLLVHAGVYPSWDVATCVRLAAEVSLVLQSTASDQFLATLRDKAPVTWDENLTGLDRVRFITNVFTQMRLLAPKHSLDYSHKGNFQMVAHHNLQPWFNFIDFNKFKRTVVFGHWASLDYYQDLPNTICVDYGCVWGRTLAALRLDDQQIFQVPAKT